MNNNNIIIERSTYNYKISDTDYYLKLTSGSKQFTVDTGNSIFLLMIDSLILESVLSVASITNCCLVTKSCPILCDPMDCSLPGSSVHGLSQARILPGVLPGNGVGCHFLLRGIFLTQELNWHLLHWQMIFFLPLSHQGSPYILQIGPPLFSNRQQARKQSLCSFLELQRIRIPLPSQISQSERKQALNLVSVIAVYRVTEGFVYLCSYISRLYEHEKAPLSISKFESYLLFATLQTVARQAPLSVGILQARELE